MDEISLSICIIAKNEEKTIGRCLSSIYDKGVQIVVVDTGSSDRTKEIAYKYTEYVYDYAWRDDFGAAKQYSVDKAKYDNILIMDCDEYIIGDVYDSLKELDYKLTYNPRHAGKIKLFNILNEENDTIYQRKNIEWITRAFNRTYYKISGKIHEQIVPSKKFEQETFLSSITIEHTGYALTKEQKKNKAHRNMVLLKKRYDELENLSIQGKIDSEEKKEIPYILYQMGKSCFMIQEYNSAYEYFYKGLSYDLDPKLEYVQSMVETYGYTMLNCGRIKEALSFSALYDTFGWRADFKFLMGLIYMRNAMFNEAVNEFKQAVQCENSSMEGVNSYLSYYNIGVIYECLGDVDNAKFYYSKCNRYEKAEEGLKRLQQ